jgi:hypothetical protein
MAIICSSSQYRYKGWYFEIHNYCGPHPLKKDGNPKALVGKKFYEMYDEFSKLSKSKQKKYMVHQGGCQTI